MPLPGTQRFICGRRVLVPATLVTTVLDLAAAVSPYAYAPEDLFATLVCTVEEHCGPGHYGAVLNLRGSEAGTIWALWREGVEPGVAVLFPDCPARSGDEVCSEFSGHPGGHSWDLHDPPPRASDAFPLPLLPPASAPDSPADPASPAPFSPRQHHPEQDSEQ